MFLRMARGGLIDTSDISRTLVRSKEGAELKATALDLLVHQSHLDRAKRRGAQRRAAAPPLWKESAPVQEHDGILDL